MEANLIKLHHYFLIYNCLQSSHKATYHKEPASRNLHMLTTSQIIIVYLYSILHVWKLCQLMLIQLCLFPTLIRYLYSLIESVLFMFAALYGGQTIMLCDASIADVG